MSSNADAWFCFPGCDCQRCGALRSVPALAADLARMTSERNGWADNCRIESRQVDTLTADLARVTAERDAWIQNFDSVHDDLDRLRVAAADVLACDKALSDARAWSEGHEAEVMVAELRMAQSLSPLRLAVDTCAPPASGEGGQHVPR